MNVDIQKNNVPASHQTDSNIQIHRVSDAKGNILFVG